MIGRQPPLQQPPSAPITQTIQQLIGQNQDYSVQQQTSLATQQVVQWLAQVRFSTSYQTPQSAHKLLHQCRGSSRMLILTTLIVDCMGIQLTILRSTIQKDITQFLMLARTSLCHTLGIRILTVIMRNNSSNLRVKDNNLQLRVNKFKCKALRLKLKGSRDEKSLAWMLMNLSIG